MNQNEADLTAIYQEMTKFFRGQSRSQKQQYQPLVFRVEYKNSLKIVDAEKHTFSVDETFLNNYRSTYTDKNYKYVKLHSWEFQIEFFGKKPIKIYMLSPKISFLPAKGASKDIDGCHFKVTIVQNQSEARTLTPEILGYLNRLGKRNIIKGSVNVAKEPKSLLNFAKKRPNKVEFFSYKPYTKPESEEKNPLDLINNEGKQVVQKLRHFISPDEVYSFLRDVQISEYSQKRLKTLLAQMQLDQ